MKQGAIMLGKMKIIILTYVAICHSIFAVAGIEHAPSDFPYQDGKAVYVDIIKANYNILINIKNKEIFVESEIKFRVNKEGYPLLDLIPNPTAIRLNNEQITTSIIQDPDKQTSLRVLNHFTKVGEHILTLKHGLTTNVVFSEEAVAFGFWMSDLNDRKFLEQYLPTNLEYDQYPMKLTVRITDPLIKEHTLKANGAVKILGKNNFEVTFPNFHTTSSLYCHFFPGKTSYKNVQFNFQSVDGRLIPVDIYSNLKIEDYVNSTKRILTELEKDYGPFPQNKLIVYGNSLSGGMEYSGATTTSLRSLGHEIFHSYNARSVMPANGNAGWMDEAIASWRDKSYPLTSQLDFASSRMAGRSEWARATDRMAYTQGSTFLSWLAYRMNERNLNFKKFLKNYFERFKHTTVTTKIFQDEVTRELGLNLTEDFNRYIYGIGVKIDESPYSSNPHHPKYTKKDLLTLTWL